MFSIKQEYEIKNKILESMKNELSKIEGSYNYDIASSTSIEISKLYEEVAELQKQLFPWSVTQDYYLDLHMKFFGLTRRGKTKAEGAVTFKGKPSTLVRIGSIVVSRIGQKYTTLENCVLDANGIGETKIESVEGGVVGNCGVGDITGFEIVIIGVDSVNNSKAVEGGFEVESFESCKVRMQEKASRPAHSGNVFDYENWTNSVGGVGKVKVVSAGEHGVLAGQVKVLVADYELNTASQQLISDVKNALNNNKPVNDDVIVESFQPFNIAITFDTVRVESDAVTKQEFINTLNLSIKDFLKGSTSDKISIARLGVLALQVESVYDYDNLTINGSSQNLDVPFNCVPVVQTIEVTNYEYD